MGSEPIIPKKKLLFILGAGSSISLKLPSVSDLDKRMNTWSSEWSRTNNCSDYYCKLWNSVEAYYQAEHKPALRRRPNFEIVLGQVMALANWMVPAPFGNPFRQIATGGAVPPGLCFNGFNHEFYPSHIINSQITHLLVRLAKHMRQLCVNWACSSQTFSEYRRLLDALRDRFDVGIYNLNYDTAALSAWPSAFTGFHDNGRFDAAAVHGRLGWSFLYHLHGSLHHTLTVPFGDEMRWQPQLDAKFEDECDGGSTDKRSDGRSLPKSTLIAGGFKLDQLLMEPFQSFYASLVRHVYEADAILIGGYGFGDTHVNRSLQNRLQGSADRPPVMVLTSSDRKDPMEFRNDPWSHELCKTLHATATDFREPGHVAPPVLSEITADDAFELSANSRVAIWHGGFVEVGAITDRILSWLDGSARDAVLTAPGGA